MNETQKHASRVALQRRRNRNFREKAASLGHARCKTSASLRMAYAAVEKMAERTILQDDQTHRAAQYLRSRGFIVYNCVVTRGSPDRWQVDRRAAMSAEELLDFEVKRGFKPVAQGSEGAY